MPSSIFSILKKNIAKADFSGQSQAVKTNAFKFAELTDIKDNYYDLVFIDPPYIKSKDCGPDSKLGILLSQIHNKLTNGAVVVVRTSSDVTLLDEYGQLKIDQRRKWGTMAVAIFIYEESNDQ